MHCVHACMRQRPAYWLTHRSNAVKMMEATETLLPANAAIADVAGAAIITAAVTTPDAETASAAALTPTTSALTSADQPSTSQVQVCLYTGQIFSAHTPSHFWVCFFLYYKHYLINLIFDWCFYFCFSYIRDHYSFCLLPILVNFIEIWNYTKLNFCIFVVAV